MIRQSLLAKCTHVAIERSQEVGDISKILDYLYNFMMNCAHNPDPSKIDNFDCAYDQMGSLRIDKKAVTACYNDFYEAGNEDSQNKLLEADTLEQLKIGIFLHPSLTINRMTYRGYIEGADVFDAVCSSFEVPPSVCSGLEDDPFGERMEELLDNMTNPVEDYMKIRDIVMYSILGFIVLLQLIFFLWYRLRKQR